MKTLHLSIIIGMILAGISLVIGGNAYATNCTYCPVIPSTYVPPSLASIDAKLDENTHDHIVITGTLYKLFSNVVVLTIQNPKGNLITISQLQPASDGAFSVNVFLSSALWSVKGNYTITVSSDSQELGQTVFYFNGVIPLSAASGHGINTLGIPLSPLKQFKSGISLDDITCKDGFFLAVSNEKNPICLKPDAISKLASRGFFYDLNSNEVKTNYATILIPPGSENQASNKTYSPDLVKIMIGVNNTVKWVNQSPDIGNTVAEDIGDQNYGKAFNSSFLKPGQSYEFTFTQPGTYHYHGEPHPWQTGTVIVLPSQVFQTENSTSSLKLFMSSDSDIIQPGKPIGITISVNNTLATTVDIPAQNNWSYPNASTGPCDTIGYGISILDGFYDKNNATQGKILYLFDPDTNCPIIQETTKVYEFQPNSGNVKQIQCKSIEDLQCYTEPYQMGQNYKFNGYWDGGTHQSFKSGIYTIVGADEWGHVAIEHFVVTNSTIFAGDPGSMSCPMMFGGVQFAATIKNSTGFANYYNSTQDGHTFFFLHPKMQGTISVQYTSPANAAWFQNNGNTPFNMTNGATLFYMANVINGKMTTSYVVSLYNDETGYHSRICHYGTHGGFSEPCNLDNKGDIPPSELPDASKLLHPGISTSFEPNFVMLYPNTNPVFTATVSANSDAMPGTYWLSLERSLCGPGVLAKLVVLP